MTTAKDQKHAKGLHRFALIVAITRRNSASCRTIAKRIGGHEGAVRELLHAMVRLGILREAVWKKRGKCIRPIPSYRSNPGERLPDPSTGELLDVVTRRNSMVKPNLTAFAALIHRMRESPASTYDLVAASGLRYLTIRALLAYGKEVGAFREADWEEREGAPGGCKIAMWACDGLAPVPRPAPMTKLERSRRHEARRVRNRVLSGGVHRLSSVFSWGAQA